MTIDRVQIRKGAAALIIAASLLGAAGPACFQASAQLNAGGIMQQTGVPIASPAFPFLSPGNAIFGAGHPLSGGIMPTILVIEAPPADGLKKVKTLARYAIDAVLKGIPAGSLDGYAGSLGLAPEAARPIIERFDELRRAVNGRMPAETAAVQERLGSAVDGAESLAGVLAAIDFEIASRRAALPDAGKLDQSMRAVNESLGAPDSAPVPAEVRKRHEGLKKAFLAALSSVRGLSEADQTPSASDIKDVATIPGELKALEAGYPGLESSSLKAVLGEASAKIAEARKAIIFIVNVQKEIRSVALSIARERGYDPENLGASQRAEVFAASRARLVENADLMGVVPFYAVKAALALSRVLERLPSARIPLPRFV